ncbi:MAG TPA: hypothetical protein VIE39_06085 [Thermoanaerobaculia bacterium]
MSAPTEGEDGAVPVPDAAEPASEPLAEPLAHSESPLDRPRARAAVSRESRGYTLRLEPADLSRLRELPGARGRSDEELGEEFLAGYADRFTSALDGEVPAPETIRVVVDPWSRQAFLAVGRTIRAILSF